jgi:hypothetical protein
MKFRYHPILALIAVPLVLLVALMLPAQTTRPVGLPVAATQSAPINVTVAPAQANSDSWPLIQPWLTKAASAPGSVINLMPAVYNLSHGLKLAGASDITFNGGKLKALPTMPLTENLLEFDQVNGLKISSVTTDGNGLARGFNGGSQSICIYACSHVAISKCTCNNSASDGIFVWSGSPTWLAGMCSNIEIVDCVIDSPNRNRISIVAGQHVYIHRNRISNVNRNTAALASAGVDIEANKGDALGVLADIRVEDNALANCYEGITAKQAASPTGVQILGNAITGGRLPINVESLNTEIGWNVLTGASGYGIGMDNGATGSIHDNQIIGCALGIYSEPQVVLGTNLVK